MTYVPVVLVVTVLMLDDWPEPLPVVVAPDRTEPLPVVVASDSTEPLPVLGAPDRTKLPRDISDVLVDRGGEWPDEDNESIDPPEPASGTNGADCGLNMEEATTPDAVVADFVAACEDVAVGFVTACEYVAVGLATEDVFGVVAVGFVAVCNDAVVAEDVLGADGEVPHVVVIVVDVVASSAGGPLGNASTREGVGRIND